MSVCIPEPGPTGSNWLEHLATFGETTLRTSKLIYALGALASLSAVSFSQTPPQDKQGRPEPQNRSTTLDNGAPRSTSAIHFGSSLIGMQVVSPMGEDLGEVEDVIVVPGSSSAYAVLSFDKQLGMGDKLFVLPWSTFQDEVRAVVNNMDRDTDSSRVDGDDPARGTAVNQDAKRTLVLSVDKQRLKQAPGFDKKNWPVTKDANWSSEIDGFYRQAELTPRAERTGDDARPVQASARNVSGNACRLSELKGRNVETPNGDNLGDVHDLAIDGEGRVVYAVLSVGGFLGMGERMVAVPWDALKFSRENDKDANAKITMTTTKEQLENGPEFKKGREHERAMVEPRWVDNVYKHYSVTPYWAKS